MTSSQTKKTYDAFLAVNKADLAAAHFVRSIAKWLEDQAGLTVWLEEWEMIPGTPWMESRENALDNSGCCIVFIGSEGIGPWQNESWRSAYETFVEKKQLRDIPAILPSGPTEDVALPPPFRRVYYLTFRDIHDEDGLERLKKAIKGEKVGRESTGARYEKLCPFLGLEAFGEKDEEFFLQDDLSAILPAFYVWNLTRSALNYHDSPSNQILRGLIMTLNIELPETLVNQFYARQISENDIKKVVLATLEIWLGQNDSPNCSRFSESAVPFVRKLIAQNRELFETLAQS